MTKKYILSLICMIALSTSLFTQEKGQDKSLREVRGLWDWQYNTKSNIKFHVTNFGILGKDIPSGVYWPHCSQNLYVLGSGFWFGAKKKVDGDMKKLVTLSYNPNSGQSWFIAGRYEDGEKMDRDKEKKYRIYFSTDFNENGTPIYETDGANWPLWVTDTEKKYEFGFYSNDYIHEEDERTIENYPLGPLFHSDEQIFSTYKDTDLLWIEGGHYHREKEGYPLGLQVEENIFTWKDGEMKDVLIITYKIKNISDNDLQECWFAPVSDIEISKAAYANYGRGNDRINYYAENEELNMVYAWSDTDRGEEGEGFGYIGYSMLETPAIDHAGYIRNDKSIFEPNEQIGLTTFRNWSIQEDKLTNEERYDFLSSEIVDGENGPGDKRLMMATGPFNMKPGDEARLAIGITFSMPAKGGEADGTYEDITGLKNSLIGLQELTKERYYQLLTSSVEEIEIDNSFVSPNPADDYLVINKPSEGFEPSEGYEIAIYNILGEKMLNMSSAKGGGQIRVDVSSLTTGTYIIKYGNKTAKFIKK